jgi:5,6-dimethylbenzimidazole synthase
VIIEDPSKREAFWEHAQVEHTNFMSTLDAERSAIFANLKIDGVLESALSIVVTYSAERGAPNVLGRRTIDDAGL